MRRFRDTFVSYPQISQRNGPFPVAELVDADRGIGGRSSGAAAAAAVVVGEEELQSVDMAALLGSPPFLWRSCTLLTCLSDCMWMVKFPFDVVE